MMIYKFREKSGDKSRPRQYNKGDRAGWLGSDGDCTEDEVMDLYYDHCFDGSKAEFQEVVFDIDVVDAAKEVAKAQVCTVTMEDVYVPRNSEMIGEWV